MGRDWHLNPPPNWPVPPGTRIRLDWRPDPAWGPPPPGWQLWQRARRRPPVAAPALAALGIGLMLVAAELAPRPAPAGPPVTSTVLAGATRGPVGDRDPVVLTLGPLPRDRGPVTGLRPGMPEASRIALTDARVLPRTPCATRAPRDGDR